MNPWSRGSEGPYKSGGWGGHVGGKHRDVKQDRNSRQPARRGDKDKGAKGGKGKK